MKKCWILFVLIAWLALPARLTATEAPSKKIGIFTVDASEAEEEYQQELLHLRGNSLFLKFRNGKFDVFFRTGLYMLRQIFQAEDFH